jgi:hypothetical protein
VKVGWRYALFVLAFCVPAAPRSPVVAQGAGATADLCFEELARSACDPSARFRVAGRYVEQHDDEIVLFESPLRFFTRSDEIRRDLLTLAAVHSNLSLVVACVAEEANGRRFEILGSAAGPSDAVLFASATSRLMAGGAKNAEDLLSLAVRMMKTREKWGDKGLQESARNTWLEGLRFLESQLAADDVDSRLKLVQKTLEALKDREFCIQLLAELEQRFPRHDPVREALLALDCRKYRGRWLTYEDFKKQQGYTQHNGRWIPGFEKSLLMAMESHQRKAGEDIDRPELEEEYLIKARRGEVTVGMKRKEVHTALGFAERVYRNSRGGKVYDLWVYRNRLVFFCEGLVFRSVTADAK